MSNSCFCMFQMNITHMPGYFLQSDICSDGQRHLLLASPLQLQHLTKAKMWFTDDTFKVVRDPFVQFTTIHSFIKSGDSMKKVPLCFVLMSRRKKHDYIVAFREILRHLPVTPAVADVVVDFERAVWSALHHCLPDVPVHECFTVCKPYRGRYVTSKI